MKFRTSIIFLLLGSLLCLSGCSIQYSFNGASIDYTKSKTVSVAYFNNMAAMVTPILSPTFTDALKQRLANQTRLQVVPTDGDLMFEGEITNYTSEPAAISGSEYAVQNRLTITVRVKFTNKADPQYSFTKTFSEYENYNTNILLTTAEQTLIPQIVDKLVDNIFNEALSTWR